MIDLINKRIQIKGDYIRGIINLQQASAALKETGFSSDECIPLLVDAEAAKNIINAKPTNELEALHVLNNAIDYYKERGGNYILDAAQEIVKPFLK
jgi:hypothetical protein